MNKIIRTLHIFPASTKIGGLIFITLSIIASLTEVLSISMILPLISLMIEDGATESNILYLYTLDIFNYLNLDFNIANLLILFSLVYIFKIFFGIYFVYFRESFGIKIYQHISNSMLKNYLEKKWSFFLNTNSAYFIRNILSESSSLKANFFMPLLKIISEIIILIGILSLLIIVNFEITFKILVILLFFLFFYKLLTKKYFINLGKKKVYQSGRLYKFLPKIFLLIREIKLLKKENEFYNYFKNLNHKYSTTNKIFSITNIVPKSLIEIIIILFIVFLFFTSYETNSNYKIIFPIFGLYFAAGYKMLPSFINIINAIRSFHYSEKPLNIFTNELGLNKIDKVKIPEDKNKLTKINFNKSIIFKNVTFKYSPKDKYIFNKFNYTINKNEIIGIKGNSGKGKTTLVNLLIGLLQPINGEILVDGVDINTNIYAWFSKIGIVHQDNVIVDDTIQNNITLSFFDKDLNDQKLTKAIKNANISELIDNLSEGLNTIVGEHGIKLSGGQKQRLCIARMLYFDPDIIILDEATSALDLENEKIILDFIKNVSGKKTVIIISHRPETISYCDKFIEI